MFAAPICQKAGMRSCSARWRRNAGLGPDGRPDDRHLLPPFPGTRRMFAARRTRFHRALKVGAAVSRISTVTRAEAKSGRSGAFVLLTIAHEISGPAGLAVTEHRNVVYREAAAPECRSGAAGRGARARRNRGMVASARHRPLLLLRYSAITFNAHRIHYDLDYPRCVEGYPALVMNGGLTALLLIETARAICGARSPLTPPAPRARCSRASASPSTGASTGTALPCGPADPAAGSHTGSMSHWRSRRHERRPARRHPRHRSHHGGGRSTATLNLADLGADVIKVEAPGGDLLRSLGGGRERQLSGKYMHFNRNKRSLALDLKRPKGREALHGCLPAPTCSSPMCGRRPWSGLGSPPVSCASAISGSWSAT